MLRNILVMAALTGFISISAFQPAQAQGLPPDDGGFEIETAPEPEEEGLLDNLSQYLGATVGTNNGTSTAVDKTISALNVQVNLPELIGLKTAVSFDVGSYKNTYKLELNESRRNNLTQCQTILPNPDDDSISALNEQQLQAFYENECYNVIDDGVYLVPEIERIVDDSFAVLAEGYVQWEPTSFATVRVGRQPIVLGQFEIFSPLMFTTPMKATGTKTKTGKADMSYAQDGVQLSLFPLPQLELSLTAIPKMRIDPANKKRFEEFALLKGDFINFVDEDGQSEILQDIGDNDMSVARLMYFGDLFTFGVTSIQGAETNEDPIREARLQQVGCEVFFPNDTPPSGSECAGGFQTVQDPFDPQNTYQVPIPGVSGQGAFDTFALTQDQGLRYAETDVIAVEFSLRLGSKLSLIVEQTIVESEKELGILPSGGQSGEKPRIFSLDNWNNFDPMDPNFDPYAGSTVLLPFYEDVYNNNDAKPYINVETTMSSAGFVYKGDRLLLNLQIAQRIQKGATEQEETWRKQLDYDTYEGTDSEQNETDILPILNAAYLLGAEKQGYVGAGFGTFGQNFGFGLSAGWRFFEKLEIGAFGGMALDVTGSDEIEAEGYDSPEGEAYLSFGANYLF